MRSKNKLDLYINAQKYSRVLYQHNLRIPEGLVGKRVLIHLGQNQLSLLVA